MPPLVIVNPAAGGGRTRRLWPALADRLRRLGAGLEHAESAGPGLAHALALDAARRGVSLVVAVGGDGTVGEVVNGLAAAGALDGVALGAVVTGRGRDAARALGLPQDPLAAADRVVEGRERRADLGEVRWPGGDRLFVNAAGVGLDAVVAARAQRLRAPGTLPYLLGLALALPGHRPVPLTVTEEGRPPEAIDVTTLVVANGPTFGGGMRIAPAADSGDGWLDLVVVGALSRCALVCWLPSVYRGTHLRHPAVSARPVVAVRLESARAPALEIDGEPVAPPPGPWWVEARVRRGVLRLRG